MITSPSHAIELLGGPKVVAAWIGCPLTTAASWSARNSIPVKVWPKIIGLAREKRVPGFTYEKLTVLHAEQVQ